MASLGTGATSFAKGGSDTLHSVRNDSTPFSPSLPDGPCQVLVVLGGAERHLYDALIEEAPSAELEQLPEQAQVGLRGSRVSGGAAPLPE